MQGALRLSTRVQEGGKVEVSSPELKEGEPVDVIVLLPTPYKRRSALEVLAEAPGHLIFKTGEEVDAYIREERDAWER